MATEIKNQVRKVRGNKGWALLVGAIVLLFLWSVGVLTWISARLTGAMEVQILDFHLPLTLASYPAGGSVSFEVTNGTPFGATTLTAGGVSVTPSPTLSQYGDYRGSIVLPKGVTTGVKTLVVTDTTTKKSASDSFLVA